MLITRIHGPKFNWMIGIDITRNVSDEIKEIKNIKARFGSSALLVGCGENTILYIR